MQRLGRALHVSSSKNIIVKAERLPKINDKVIDENLKSVGTVSDIFGPVSSPYVAVRPSAQNPERFVNHVLYVFPSRKRGWKKRK